MKIKPILYSVFVFGLLTGCIIIGSCIKKPCADFGVNTKTVTAGDTVWFKNFSSNATFYEWDFGEGTISTSANPMHVYHIAGNYQVQLTAIDSKKKYFSTISKAIHVAMQDTTKVKDINGNYYDVVRIGNQLWMAENLRTTKLNDGTPLDHVTDNFEWEFLAKPKYCWYENNPQQYGMTHGALYSWGVAVTNKLCPQGWKVPSKSDFEELINFVGGDSYSAFIALSEGGTTGFNALCSGIRIYNGEFDGMGYSGGWLSSSHDGNYVPWYMNIHQYAEIIYFDTKSGEIGASVRCLKE